MSAHAQPSGLASNLDNVVPNEYGQKSTSSKHTSRRSIDVFEHGLPEGSQGSPESQNHSKDVADRNSGSPSQLHHIVDSAKSIARRLRRKHRHTPRNGPEDSDTSDDEHNNDGNESGLPSISTKRKPLPPTPEVHSDIKHTQHQEPQGGAHHHTIDEQTRKKLAAVDVDLENVVDTFQHTHLAPAVTKETIQPVVHNIRQEKITRDIHNVDIIHRELPIKQVEVLPARHFVRTPTGSLSEVSLTDLPDALAANQSGPILHPGTGPGHV